MELQACGGSAAGGVGKPSVSRGQRRRPARRPGWGLAAAASSGCPPGGGSRRDRLSSRSPGAAGSTLCSRPARGSRPQNGRLGRRPGAARWAAAEPNGEISPPGRPRYLAAAARPAGALAATPSGRSRSRRPAVAPDHRYRPVPLAGPGFAAPEIGAAAPRPSRLATRS